MKKLILLLVLSVSLNLMAQVNNEIIFKFNQVYDNTGQMSDRETTLLFKGNGCGKLIILSKNLVPITLERKSEIIEGKTKGGYQFLEAEFISEEGESVFVQLFLDIEYGIRVLFPTYSYQYI